MVDQYCNTRPHTSGKYVSQIVSEPHTIMHNSPLLTLYPAARSDAATFVRSQPTGIMVTSCVKEKYDPEYTMWQINEYHAWKHTFCDERLQSLLTANPIILRATILLFAQNLRFCCRLFTYNV